MSVPRPIRVLNFCLVAGLLAAASPARAEPAGNYNDAQLKLLFSGAEVEATGEIVCRSYPAVGDVTLKFDFAADGSFTVDYECSTTFFTGVYDVGSDTGNWRVEGNELCLEVSESATRAYFPSHKNCWPVKHGKYQFGLYAGSTAFWKLNVSHPKYPTKEKLLAALGELAGKTAAKADLTLPPAEYKPLPAGTIVNYDKRTYTVMESRGFEIVVKESKKGHWQRPYAVFGRQGFDSYTFRVRQVWRDWLYDANFDDAGKSALQRLWPLKVGNKTELGFEETYHGTSGGIPQRPWKLKVEVLRTEFLELNGIRYPTFVVRTHAVSEHQELTWVDFPEQEYTETHWYNPDSGLVLKFRRDWIRGGEADSNDAYELVSVSFPKGTTLALKGTSISGEAQTAKATTLPPAPYKPLLVGTKIKYDDRIYRVTKTDGFLTTYRSVTGEKLSYLNAYALFGEYADNLHVAAPRDDAVVYDIDTDNRKKLEVFWPLKVGNKTSFRLEEGGTIATQADTWNITLKVLRAEVLSLKGKKYPSYVIEERGLADSGKSYVGRKWYHPATGLIVKAERKWIKSFSVGGSYWRKEPHFAEGEVDNYTLVRARFPEGAVAVAAKQEPKAPPAAETARLKRAAETRKAETARKARAQEIARLERKAEAVRKARAAEIARLEREAEENRKAEAARKTRTQQIARLKREAEAARKAREAEVSQVTAAEMARLKQEADAVRRVHEAEIADLKHEAEVIRKVREARETEIARLKKQAEAARKAREAEIATLKRKAEETRKANEARDIEFAGLRRQLDEFLKARKTAEAPKATIADGLAGIEFGNYNALVIGINNYKNLPKLTTAINDAKGVAKILKEEYGFKVTTLIDPDRLDIIDAFDELKDALTEEDNLLIYYAGHGWLDQDTDRGYWLPVDAKPGRRSRWVSNATITDTLKGLSAKHVMVVADSCYSGTLVRGADVGTRKRKGEYWKEMASKWARVAITSGGLEPVSDKGGGKNSPFAKAFIDALSDNDSIIDGLQLFGKMRRPVMIASDQTPQYADVRNAGHDGGDFLFVRRK